MTVSALMWLVGGALMFLGSMGLTRFDVGPAWLPTVDFAAGMMTLAAASYTSDRAPFAARVAAPLTMALGLLAAAAVRFGAGGREWIIGWTVGFAAVFVAVAALDTVLHRRAALGQSADEDIDELGLVVRIGEDPLPRIPERGAIPRTGLLTGGLAGLAMAAVLVVAAIAVGVRSGDPFRSIAVGWLGAPALEGGAGAVLCGALTLLAVGAGLGWLYTELMYPQRSAVTHFLGGLFYGALLWGTMTFLVLPVVNPSALDQLSRMTEAWLVSWLAFGATYAALPWVRRVTRKRPPRPVLRLARAA